MKKIFLSVGLAIFSLSLSAQYKETERDEPTGFQKEKLFTGGDLTLAFYTGGTTLGVSPYLGYSLTKWLDAALSVNVIYQGQKDYSGIKYRQTNIGPGAFVRIFPVNFLISLFSIILKYLSKTKINVMTLKVISVIFVEMTVLPLRIVAPSPK